METNCGSSPNSVTGILNKSAAEDKKSGFFDLPIYNQCLHPEHKPPMYIYIPQGKGYRHICPHCGKETILIPTQISL